MQKTTPISLKWSKVPTASNYDWSLAKLGGPTIGGAGVLPPASAGVLGYGAYEWDVTSLSAEGVAWKSTTYPFYVTIHKSPKPDAVVVPDVLGNITFAWNAYPGATNYDLNVWNNPNCSGGALYTPSTTATFRTTGPFTPGTWSWKVTPNPDPAMPCQPFTVP
jgi:hypothetical protein